MTPPLRASVVIPTYNRSYFLARVLDGLSAQNLTPATFEVIVVDNNSNDDTLVVFRTFAGAHSQMQLGFVHETRQGLSHSRNRGVVEARAGIICYLDDDAVPSGGWLGAILARFADPSVGCVGGPAILDYLGQERPPWLRGDLQGLIGGYSLPYAVPTAVSERYGLPYGCNMAFRRQVFEEVGLFRPDLDPAGDVRILGGETELISRVGRAGWRIEYVPDAIVHHLVPPRKMLKLHLVQEGKVRAATHVILTLDPHLQRIVRWCASDLWFAVRMFFRFAVAWLSRKESRCDDYMRFWILAQRLRIRLHAIWRRQYSREGILAQVKETRL